MHHTRIPADDTRRSFTVAEIAARHRTSRTTIYAEIAAGRLRSYTLGRARRISVEAEQDWIAARESEAAA